MKNLNEVAHQLADIGQKVTAIGVSIALKQEDGDLVAKLTALRDAIDGQIEVIKTQLPP